MADRDQLDLNRIANILRECSYNQVVDVLRRAGIGHRKTGKDGSYEGWIVPSEEETLNEDFEDSGKITNDDCSAFPDRYGHG